MKKLLNTLYITSDDAYCRLDGENIVIERTGDHIVRLPLHTVESIVIFSYRGVSPALLGKCAENGIDISFFTPEGRFLARVAGMNSGNVLLRRSQYRIADDEASAMEYSRNFIIGKIFNSRWILERMCRDHSTATGITGVEEASDYLKQKLGNVVGISSPETLRGIEGECAKKYFSVFNSLILANDDVFCFNGRSRRPPCDSVNALLSFAYSILAKDCASALAGVGLDPYVGFMHSDRPGRMGLALDLEEELRGPIADRFVLTGINLKIFTRRIFDFQENGAVLLNNDGRKTFLTEWQKRKKEKIRHPFLKEKIEWGLVPHVQALLLARTIRGDLSGYPPFTWK